MTPRTLGALGFVLSLLPTFVVAQVPQAPAGATTPGPAAPRPQMPPRDGSALVAPTGTGRIRGRVMAADTSAPLRRAQVRVSANQPGLQQTAITDADGRYEFLNVPAARYTLSATSAGYVSLQFGQQTPSQPARPITLAEGEVVDKIDFTLPRGGVIAGRVFDDTGQPVAGVRVQAQRYLYQPGGERRLMTMGTTTPYTLTTDDLGQFRVYGLMPGSYVLSADPQMFGGGITLGPATTILAGSSTDGNDGYATTYFPGTANVDEAQTVTVSLGQEATASFSLVSARMSRISGFVRNSQGSAVGRTPIMLATRNGAGAGAPGINGITQPDGSFALANVPPGEHILEVRPIQSSFATVIGAAATEEFASVPVTTAGQDISGLMITTGLGATISGRVIFEGKSQPSQGMVQSLRIFPTSVVPGIQVSMGSSLDMGAVDESRHFQIRGVSGQILFRHTFAALASPPSWYLKSVTLDGVDITDTPFDAKSSTNATGVEVTMTDQQTTVAGLVRDVRGDTIKTFVVALFPAVGRNGVAAQRFTRTVRPDLDGRYQSKGLPPGDYVAVAVESIEQGSEWDPAFQQQMKPKGKAFHLAEGESVTLDLTLVQ